jgi:hypothetical protein
MKARETCSERYGFMANAMPEVNAAAIQPYKCKAG